MKLSVVMGLISINGCMLWGRYMFVSWFFNRGKFLLISSCDASYAPMSMGRPVSFKSNPLKSVTI